MEEKKFVLKEPKESLHWISFSIGKLAKEAASITMLLAKLVDQLAPLKQPKKDEYYQNKNEDLPF